MRISQQKQLIIPCCSYRHYLVKQIEAKLLGASLKIIRTKGQTVDMLSNKEIDA
jgi:hypothetical protein